MNTSLRAVVDQDILRLDVAVNDAATVGVVQPDQHLVEVVAKFVVAETGIELLESSGAKSPTL